MTTIEIPPPEQFILTGTCHWCGEKNRAIATVGSIQLGPKTRICLECAGHEVPRKGKTLKTKQYLASVVITLNIAASSQEEGDKRAETLGDKITVAWPKAKWVGDEYEVTTSATDADQVQWN